MKTVRRSLALLLAIMTLCSLLVMPASAASTTAYDCLSDSKYAKTYAVNTGTIIPYTSTSLSTRGTVSYGRSSSSYIDGYNDLLYVMDAGTNSSGQAWAKVSYPVGNNKRVIAYVKLSDLTANTHSTKSVSSGKFLCALRQNGSLSSSYYVAKGDTVWLLAVSGSRVQILYPAGSAYRIAWANKSDYDKYCGTPGPSQSIPNGKYVIVSAIDQNKAVDVSGASNSNCANIQLWTRNGSGAQTFTLTYQSGGWYTIVNTQSGKSLDVASGIARCGQNVWQYECNGTNAQKWYLESAGNGWYYIRSALGYYLDVSGGGNADGTNIQIWTGNRSNAQKFRFESTGFSPVWPCKNSNTISTMYRYWNSGNPKDHGVRSNKYNAFDISGSSGDPILAIESGTVVEKGYKSGGFGHYVVIEHSNGLRSLYAHMKQEASVSKGDSVSRSQQIGLLGSTGNSTGPHLHLEVYDPNNYGRVINPWVSYYQGKVAVTVGGNSYKANSRYPNDATAKAWCDWLTNHCTKSGSSYVFRP